MKAFRWRLFWCVAPVVVSLVVVSIATWNYVRAQQGLSHGTGLNYTLGVDLVGGTILVYEVDVSKFKDGKLPDGYKPEQLVTALKRRIDPNDLYNITIRPLGPTRVEIIMPTGEAARTPGEGGATLTPEKVNKMKELIAQVGSMEFRILASDADDGPAIEAAKQLFEKAKTSPSIQSDLEERNRAGKPPPGPTPPEKDGFLVENKGRFNYSWIELGKNFRAEMGLDNAAEKVPAPSVWSTAAEHRAKGEPYLAVGQKGERVWLYSREIPASRVLPDKDKDKKYEYFALARDIAEGKENPGLYIEGASVQNGEVDFQLKAQGGELMGDLTGPNVDRQMAIVLDGQVMSSANIKSKINDRGRIEGTFTPDYLDFLVTVLRSGALPASLKPVPVSENTMGPTLGADTIMRGTIAVLLAFVAILFFMIVYYRFAGTVACIALLANLLLTVAFMVLVQATYTLPGLAGLVLMLGMAVDANVLIYERLREERERGASIGLAIRNGYDRAFPTIIDTHLSSIFTAIVLYTVGNDQLKGFGISLTVGLIISLFTSLYMTRLMFDFWLSKGWLHELKMMDLKKFPVFNLFIGKHIDFMRIRYYWFTATVLLTIFGITVFLIRSNQGLNIDFTGGTAITYELKDLHDITYVRDKLENEKAWESQLQVTEAQKLDDEGFRWNIRYKGEQEAHNILLPNAVASETEVRDRAKQLPDLSVEQIFMGSSEFSQGNQSRIVTVRTSEKASELVELIINRLLDTDLKRIGICRAEVSPNNKEIRLDFCDQDAEGKPDGTKPTFASPAQVTMLLQRKFQAAGLGNLAQQMTLSKQEGTEEKDGLYQKMVIHLPETVDPALPPEQRDKLVSEMHEKLVGVVNSTEDDFSKRPQPFRLEVFDKTLAEDTQGRALTAILASWGAILLYLWFRFGNWTFGAATVACLIHDLFFTLGIIAFCHYIHKWFPGFATLLGIHDFKIDLPTVAALLTLVGYSVNDTIVVFDRIREVRGKNPLLTPQMINDGVNQTLSRTLLTAFSVWLVVFVLYVFGGAGIHLFAFVMVVGVIVGTYSSIYIASPLLLIFGEGVPAKKPTERPAERVATTA
jgi:SecD/SecF fusion protein